jgi:hypothetical protein
MVKLHIMDCEADCPYFAECLNNRIVGVLGRTVAREQIMEQVLYLGYEEVRQEEDQALLSPINYHVAEALKQGHPLENFALAAVTYRLFRTRFASAAADQQAVADRTLEHYADLAGSPLSETPQGLVGCNSEGPTLRRRWAYFGRMVKVCNAPSASPKYYPVVPQSD